MGNSLASPWKRVWDEQKFDDLYNRDERYFALVIKGMMRWLTNNIVLYGKPVRHFIYTTGSSFMYVENNGYIYSTNETSGEDWVYMQMPRCIVELSGISIPTDELTSPYSNGIYERKDGENIRGFYAQMRRIPIDIDINLKYVLSKFNELIILCEELISKIVFQRYFNISYMGQIVRCSIEFPQDFNIEINKIDMTDPNITQKNLQLAVKISSYYPSIDTDTEITTDKVISAFNYGIETPVCLTLLDENKQQVILHVKKIDNETKLVDSNDNIIENEVFYDGLGNKINKEQAINKIIALTSIPTESTLFFKDITNTVDVISRDKILK